MECGVCRTARTDLTPHPAVRRGNVCGSCRELLPPPVPPSPRSPRHSATLFIPVSASAHTSQSLNIPPFADPGPVVPPAHQESDSNRFGATNGSRRDATPTPTRRSSSLSPVGRVFEEIIDPPSSSNVQAAAAAAAAGPYQLESKEFDRFQEENREDRTHALMEAELKSAVDETKERVRALRALRVLVPNDATRSPIVTRESTSRQSARSASRESTSRQSASRQSEDADDVTPLLRQHCPVPAQQRVGHVVPVQTGGIAQQREGCVGAGKAKSGQADAAFRGVPESILADLKVVETPRPGPMSVSTNDIRIRTRPAQALVRKRRLFAPNLGPASKRLRPTPTTTPTLNPSNRLLLPQAATPLRSPAAAPGANPSRSSPSAQNNPRLNQIVVIPDCGIDFKHSGHHNGVGVGTMTRAHIGLSGPPRPAHGHHGALDTVPPDSPEHGRGGGLDTIPPDSLASASALAAEPLEFGTGVAVAVAEGAHIGDETRPSGSGSRRPELLEFGTGAAVAVAKGAPGDDETRPNGGGRRRPELLEFGTDAAVGVAEAAPGDGETRPSGGGRRGLGSAVFRLVKCGVHRAERVSLETIRDCKATGHGCRTVVVRACQPCVSRDKQYYRAKHRQRHEQRMAHRAANQTTTIVATT
jgi:hypothetical protein